MSADPNYLRQHYASLSDSALRAIDRADLVDAAQKCYDDEVKQRELDSKPHPQHPDEDSADEDADIGPAVDSNHPDWLEDAAEVYSRLARPGNAQEAEDVADARDALEAAGIPCYLDLTEQPEETVISTPSRLWRLLVPGNLNLRATSVLDRDIFDQEFEATWRTHLETLSDAELRQMSPQVVFCGLFDRVERVTNAYADELVRRRLTNET